MQHRLMMRMQNHLYSKENNNMKQTHIFLIKVPYLHLFKGEQVNMFPIGLATIAAVLRKHSFPITFLDPENQEMSSAEVVEKIKREKPTVVGVSCVSANYNLALEYLKAAKEVGSYTVLGGNHASSGDPKTLLEQAPYVDFLLFGEADYTVLELCEFLEQKREDYKNILGLAYRKGGSVFVNDRRPFIENIDDIPQPVWDLVNMNKYTVSKFIWRGKGAVPLMTSRGCPTFCIFCATSQVNGRKFRAQSAERIVADIEHLIKTYNTRYIVLLDDIFTINKERVRKFSQLMIEKKIKIKWFCLARVNTVDKELLKLMRKAGCNWIEYGVESGDEEVLKNVKKGITVQQAKEAFKAAREVGIRVLGTFMFGNPGETRETMEKTIKLAIELNPDIAQFSIVAPLPGTELWEKYRGTLYILKNDLENSTTYGINTQSSDLGYKHRDFSDGELQQMLSIAFRRFYLRPSYAGRQLLKMRSIQDLLYLLEGAQTVSKQLMDINFKKQLLRLIKVRDVVTSDL